MILINLLPHREAARKRRRDVFNVSLGLSALVGGLIAGAVFLWFQAAISGQQGVNGVLQAEIKKLEAQIADIVGLEAEIAALRARQQAVEDLQSDRNLPVHLMTEIVNQLPDGVYLTKMAQVNQVVTMNGVAQSQERVADLIRNLSSNTPWLAKPELVEIIAGSIALSARDQKRVSNFVIRVKLLRASEAAKNVARPSEASSTPVAAASSVAIKN